MTELGRNSVPRKNYANWAYINKVMLIKFLKEAGKFSDFDPKAPKSGAVLKKMAGAFASGDEARKFEFVKWPDRA